MRTRSHRFISILTITALAVSGGVAASAAAAESDTDVTIGALDTPPTTEDKLPSWFANTQAAPHMKLASARYVDTVRDRRYFLLEGADSGLTCLIYVTAARSSAGTCADTQEALTKGIYLIEGDEDAAVTAVVVPDGYENVSSDADVHVVGDGDNLTILQGEAPDSLTLTEEQSSDGVTIEVGPLAPAAA